MAAVAASAAQPFSTPKKGDHARNPISEEIARETGATVRASASKVADHPPIMRLPRDRRRRLEPSAEATVLARCRATWHGLLRAPGWRRPRRGGLSLGAARRLAAADGAPWRAHVRCMARKEARARRAASRVFPCIVFEGNKGNMGNAPTNPLIQNVHAPPTVVPQRCSPSGNMGNRPRSPRV